MAAPSVTYTFSNSTTADATEVNQNFTDIINGITDGTKDLTINLLTVNGAASFNGNVTLGNATGDDVTVTGRVASDVIPKTADTYDLGNATLTWRAMYLDNDTTDGGAIYFDGTSTKFIKANAAGTSLQLGGFDTLDKNGVEILGVTDGSNAAAGEIGECIEATGSTTTVSTDANITSVTLTAGDWDLQGSVFCSGAADDTRVICAITTDSSSTTTGALNGRNRLIFAYDTGSGIGSGSIPAYRISITSSATYYINVNVVASSCTSYGYIMARRVR